MYSAHYGAKRKSTRSRPWNLFLMYSVFILRSCKKRLESLSLSDNYPLFPVLLISSYQGVCSEEPRKSLGNQWEGMAKAKSTTPTESLTELVSFKLMYNPIQRPLKFHKFCWVLGFSIHFHIVPSFSKSLISQLF